VGPPWASQAVRGRSGPLENALDDRDKWRARGVETVITSQGCFEQVRGAADPGNRTFRRTLDPKLDPRPHVDLPAVAAYRLTLTIGSAERADHLDQLVGPISVPACKADELPGLRQNESLLRGSGDANAEPAAKLEEAFVAEFA
jgi:hypothetical protein